MSSSWHNFRTGQHYSLEDVVATCERRIKEGKVKDVRDKRDLLAQMRLSAPRTVVWSPFSTGWGASPFNPNCWRTVQGTPILPDEA
ncbi:MAG: hypothetical protein AKCLJLPJ_02205 [Fimbriimonadales bacterium]|nr:MAG: hypothetical protein EDM73_07600 [Armatimonadota bacterium]MBV6504105.1 hypothetical protein [Fimbriimonadales bacterium]MCE7900265.1 hypothetical protein [Armatimonadetes bacterium ATM1]MDL1928421.1 hypothetical protein [Fimbriimonadia bacterium ATM]MBC6969961.1 hypothetical protein [Armatimonadota bacterium]